MYDCVAIAVSTRTLTPPLNMLAGFSIVTGIMGSPGRQVYGTGVRTRGSSTWRSTLEQGILAAVTGTFPILLAWARIEQPLLWLGQSPELGPAAAHYLLCIAAAVAAQALVSCLATCPRAHRQVCSRMMRAPLVRWSEDVTKPLYLKVSGPIPRAPLGFEHNFTWPLCLALL